MDRRNHNEKPLTCVLRNAHDGMLGSRILHDIRCCNEGIGRAEVDDNASTDISGPASTSHGDSILGFHGLADSLHTEEGPLDIDLVEPVKFGQRRFGDFQRLLHPNLETRKQVSGQH